MDPTQTRIFLVTALVSLVVAAQVAVQTGAFVALP